MTDSMLLAARNAKMRQTSRLSIATAAQCRNRGRTIRTATNNVAGMADDNVLFQNSTQVYSELIEQGKIFYAVDYPGSKHSMNGAKVKSHLYTQIFDFLERELRR